MRSFRTRPDRRASARVRAQSALALLKYKSNSLEARVQCRRWLNETCSLLFAWRRSHDQTVSCRFLHRWHNVVRVLESHRLVMHFLMNTLTGGDAVVVTGRQQQRRCTALFLGQG